MTLQYKVRTAFIGYWILVYKINYMTGRWKELFCLEVDKYTGRGPGGEVWFQVENMVETRFQGSRPGTR